MPVMLWRRFGGLNGRRTNRRFGVTGECHLDDLTFSQVEFFVQVFHGPTQGRSPPLFLELYYGFCRRHTTALGGPAIGVAARRQPSADSRLPSADPGGLQPGRVGAAAFGVVGRRLHVGVEAELCPAAPVRADRGLNDYPIAESTNNRLTIQAWCGSPLNCNNGNEIFSFHPGGARFLMGDGAVRLIVPHLSPATFLPSIPAPAAKCPATTGEPAIGYIGKPMADRRTKWDLFSPFCANPHIQYPGRTLKLQLPIVLRVLLFLRDRHVICPVIGRRIVCF